MHLNVMILMKIAGVKDTLKSDHFEESIYYKIHFRPSGIILDIICRTASSTKSLYT